MADRLEALKEILATKSIDEIIILKGKYRDLFLFPDDVEVINRHISYLHSKQCIEESKGDIGAYAQCSLNKLKVTLGEEGNPCGRNRR